jgi:hypothetical protein
MSAIKAGDLVVVIKARNCACKNRSHSIGAIYTVISVEFGFSVCGYCGRKLSDVPECVAELRLGSHTQFSRLKKIDPPALPEAVENRYEVPA